MPENITPPRYFTRNKSLSSYICTPCHISISLQIPNIFVLSKTLHFANICVIREMPFLLAPQGDETLVNSGSPEAIPLILSRPVSHCISRLCGICVTPSQTSSVCSSTEGATFPQFTDACRELLLPLSPTFHLDSFLSK